MLVCVGICVYVLDAILRFLCCRLPLKLMIWGPENQQIQPRAGHNGEHDLPVDVFEDCFSFFSVSTSPLPHNRHIYNTNSRVM